VATLSILTPLRVESLAVGGSNLVVGMGPVRARRAGARLTRRLGADAAVAVVGVAGGLADDLRTGDLVVATGAPQHRQRRLGATARVTALGRRAPSGRAPRCTPGPSCPHRATCAAARARRSP